MKKWYLVPVLLALIVLIHACQKEKSFESGGIPSQGSLQADGGTGECLPKSVVGSYEVATEVTADNYIEVAVDVTLAGQYTVITDTINGIYFRGAGIFTTLGLNTIRLTAHGTPFAAGTNNFVVSYGTSTCTIAVVTLPEGGGGPAVFTLEGAPGACANATPAGTYTAGSPLGTANDVQIFVNVTAIGTYNISTTATNGMTFSATGTFGTLGAQTVTLAGSGTPVTTGPTQIPVPGTQSCTFTVNVVGQATYTVDCPSSAVQGTYTQGVALASGNTVTFNVDVTAAGGYSFTGTVDGMTFSASGTFAATGPGQVVTLTGTGTPTSAGVVDLLINTPGGGICPIVITVDPGSVIDWSFNESTFSYSGAIIDATLDTLGETSPGHFAMVLTYDGDNAGGEEFFFQLADFDGGVNAGETYTTSPSPTVPENVALLDFAGTKNYTSDPSVGGTTTIFTITAHDPILKTFTGTFAGTAFDESNVIKTLTGGTFRGHY